jgi:hypothetical protein
LGGRGIVEEKPDDDEITSYITGLNTVIAKQENSSNQNTIPRLKTNKQDTVPKILRYLIILNILLINHLELLTKYLYGGVL